MDINLRKNKNNLLFIPVGGSNEIGMNFNIYHLDSKFIIIDCGIGFSNDDHLKNNPILPDISFFKTQKNNILAIIITHIHEDHIGALEYIYHQFNNIPIYCTKLASKLIIDKFANSSFLPNKDIVIDNKIKIIDDKSKLSLGSFQIEFISLTHSAIEMKAIYIKNKIANIFHSGDWKFDDNPIVGNLSDKERIKNLDIDAFICDSTNIFQQKESKSESSIVENIDKLVKSKKNNIVIITTFASNIARLKTLFDIAVNNNRKILLLGFSLKRIVKIAKLSGYLSGYENVLISSRNISNYKKNQILVIATGCQGEENASIFKLANNLHKDIKLSKNDLVIFSSKIIPGNEVDILTLFNKFADNDIDVAHEMNHHIHVSGHPGQMELSQMYKLVNPKILIPTHGTRIHLKEHAAFAKKNNIKSTIVPYNGAVININKDSANIIGDIYSKKFTVEGANIVNIDDNIFNLRKNMAKFGLINIIITLDKKLRLKSNIIFNPISIIEDKYYTLFEKEAAIIITSIVKSMSISKSDYLKEANSIKNKLFFTKKNDIDYNMISNILSKNIEKKLSKIVKDLLNKRSMFSIVINII